MIEEKYNQIITDEHRNWYSAKVEPVGKLANRLNFCTILNNKRQQSKSPNGVHPEILKQLCSRFKALAEGLEPAAQLHSYPL